ncbi:hypothetical protein HPB51_003862 [Rhipicephalus microplus]|uniref:THAP-type domain-containing protein n=1 Tax=Rhipicephalus microplus TaxID=6941 RepID=A0A9J6ELL7_RHIMP|nr:hypothetical protein HPB51_003862 [Rhipicephalus microplus]
MVSSCVAFGCTNRAKQKPGITFHLFPKDKTLRDAWQRAVRRDGWEPKRMRTFSARSTLKQTALTGRAKRPDCDQGAFLPFFLRSLRISRNQRKESERPLSVGLRCHLSSVLRQRLKCHLSLLRRRRIGTVPRQRSLHKRFSN